VRFIALGLLITTTGCSLPAKESHHLVPLSGTIAVKSYPAVAGNLQQGYVLELDRSFQFEGTVYSEVRLSTYNDSVMFTIHDAVSKHISTSCSFTTVSPWVHQTLVCWPHDIRVEP
jgi:hypothetical protein